MAREADVAIWWEGVDRRAHFTGDPISPQFLVVLDPSAGRRPDLGRQRNGGKLIRPVDQYAGRHDGLALSDTLATMCPAVPYTTAAKFACPSGRPSGSWAMARYGCCAIPPFITIAKYWRMWSDPRCVSAVLNNRDLNQVTWGMRAMGGYPRLEETQALPAFDYSAHARILGLEGIHGEGPKRSPQPGTVPSPRTARP